MHGAQEESEIMKSVVVFDYGFGNVRSMMRALANQDLDVTLTSDYRKALEADGLVVPGVGAFGACMQGLRKVNGDNVIYDRLRAGRPVLGVCVGEQIMFTRGTEHDLDTPGLQLIDGEVSRLDADVVPHIGWDTVDAPEGSVLLNGVEGERFYFVHSYAAFTAAITAAAISWPAMSAGLCSPRSSTRRSPRRQVPDCSRTGPPYSSYVVICRILRFQIGVEHVTDFVAGR